MNHHKLITKIGMDFLVMLNLNSFSTSLYITGANSSDKQTGQHSTITKLATNFDTFLKIL